MALRYFSSLVLLFFSLSCNHSDIITKSEKEWLNKHPNLVVGLSPNAPPYQFINENGEEVGIFIDFLTIIENRLDYKFKKVYQSDFSKLLNGTKEGSVDVLLEVQKTGESQQFLNFTPVHISHKYVIVVRTTTDNIKSISDLKSRKIAVVNQYAVQEYLTNNYPDYSLLALFDDVACLRAVSTGQADAFICQQAVSTYYIVNEGISNLKIAGAIDYSNELAIASRTSQDTLNSILSKAANSLTKTDKQNIYGKWLSYEIKPFYFEARFWIIIAIVFLIALSLIMLFNLVLQKKVNQKTRELKTAKEKAEESDRLKSAFLANLSHEIRTPMGGIFGFSNILKQADLTDDEQQKYIELIEESAMVLLNIFNNFFDFLKIETGQMELFLIQSDINKLIVDIYDIFKPKAEAKGLKFSIVNALPSMEATIITDYDFLRAILDNLIKNAIKFTDNGSIELGYNLVETHGRASLPISDRAFLQFYVKDTGIGMSKVRQQAIFERYIIDYERAYQGNGLGLVIAKSRVEMLGGKIWVESEEGVGSTFYFTLPYNPGHEEKDDI
ncbi:MAG: transporter substrate-binding domain-containing protein [Mariniphaga sp.]